MGLARIGQGQQGQGQRRTKAAKLACELFEKMREEATPSPSASPSASASASVARGPMPTTRTYTCAIESYGRVGKWSKAVEVLNSLNGRLSLSTDQPSPDDAPIADVAHFNAAITACGRAKQWRQSLALIDTMRQPPYQLKPDSITFNAAITACEKSGQWQRVLMLLHQMASEGLKPDLIRCVGAPPHAARHAPRTTHHAPRTTHRAPRTTHHAPHASYQSPMIT